MYLSKWLDATKNVPRQFMSPVTFQNGMPLKRVDSRGVPRQMWLSKWKADSCLIEKHAQALSATTRLETTQSEFISSKGALTRNWSSNLDPYFQGTCWIHVYLFLRKITDLLNPKALANAQRIQSKWEKDGSVLCCSYQDLPAEVGSMRRIVSDEKMFLIRICNVASLFQLVFRKLILTKSITSRFQISFPLQVELSDSRWLANLLMWMLRDSIHPKWWIPY